MNHIDKDNQNILKDDKKSKMKISTAKANKKISNPNSIKEINLNSHMEPDTQNDLHTINNEYEEIEKTQDGDNSRRKRRRSSASSE